MSLRGFQQALAELVMSLEFCSAVKADPQQALAGFELSPIERERLVALARAPGLKIGTMIHRSFRLSILANFLPQTRVVLGIQGFKEVVHDYWNAQPPRNLYYEQEAVRFGEFVLAQLEQGRIQNEFLEEVLALELAVLSLARNLGGTSDERRTSSDPRTCFPDLHAGCRMIVFRHEPAALFEALGEGRVPEDAPRGRYYLLLDRSASEQLQMHQIDPQIGALLAACDGHTSAALLCERLSATVRDLEALAEEGYLIFRNQPAGGRSTLGGVRWLEALSAG
jgi:hypothetical protein